MARQLRIEFEGAFYPITSRGNLRGDVFFEEKDREIFLEILTKTKERYSYLLHAYVFENRGSGLHIAQGSAPLCCFEGLHGLSLSKISVRVKYDSEMLPLRGDSPIKLGNDGQIHSQRMDPIEHLEIINDKGEVIGIAPRSEIHGNPALLHRVVHVLVFNEHGHLLLQKRSEKKDVAPGRWDTSVGGHVGVGEDLLSSSMREMEEELGVAGHEPEYLYSYIHSNRYETELVTTYRCKCEGDFLFNKEEIDEIRFWSFEEIQEASGKQILSDNFEQEFMTYLGYLQSNGL